MCNDRSFYELDSLNVPRVLTGVLIVEIQTAGCVGI